MHPSFTNWCHRDLLDRSPGQHRAQSHSLLMVNLGHLIYVFEHEPPQWHRENMQTPHRKAPGIDLGVKSMSCFSSYLFDFFLLSCLKLLIFVQEPKHFCCSSLCSLCFDSPVNAGSTGGSSLLRLLNGAAPDNQPPCCCIVGTASYELTNAHHTFTHVQVNTSLR